MVHSGAIIATSAMLQVTNRRRGCLIGSAGEISPAKSCRHMASAGPARIPPLDTTPPYFTFTHASERPEAMIASQIFVVSSASRKVGAAGLPVDRPSIKSATVCTKECS